MEFVARCVYEKKRLPWWTRFRLWLCPLRVSVDYGSKDGHAFLFYKVLRGVVYIVDHDYVPGTK